MLLDLICYSECGLSHTPRYSDSGVSDTPLRGVSDAPCGVWDTPLRGLWAYPVRGVCSWADLIEFFTEIPQNRIRIRDIEASIALIPIVGPGDRPIRDYNDRGVRNPSTIVILRQ